MFFRFLHMCLVCVNKAASCLLRISLIAHSPQLEQWSPQISKKMNMWTRHCATDLDPRYSEHKVMVTRNTNIQVIITQSLWKNVHCHGIVSADIVSHIQTQDPRRHLSNDHHRSLKEWTCEPDIVPQIYIQDIENTKKEHWNKDAVKHANTRLHQTFKQKVRVNVQTEYKAK